LFVLRADPLAALLLRADRGQQQRGRQSAPHHEDIFSAAVNAARFDLCRALGLPDFVRVAARHDGVLRYEARADGTDDPTVHGHGNRAWRWTVAVGLECAVQRYPIHGSIPDADLAVCHTRGVCGVTRAEGLATVVRVESDGRSHRGIPVGAARTGECLCENHSRVARHRGPDLDRRSVLLPAHRAHVRGHRLMPPVIVAENLSKRYTLGYRERYGTVRDSLKSTLTAPKRWLQRN